MLKRPELTFPNFAATLALCGLAYVIYWSCLYVLYGSYDTGWLLQVGQHILNHGVPQSDPFSWTQPGCRYVAYQWLFAALLAQIFRCGTLWLVGLVCATAAIFLTAFILPRTWMNKGIPAYVPLGCIALWVTPHWFNARPQLCSFYFIVAFIAVLERVRTGNGKWLLLLLPPLSLLWVNLHAFWFIGLIIASVYLCADCIRTKRLSASLAGCLIACAAVSLLNPYGFGLVQYLMTFADSSQYMNIWELKPWLASEEFWWTAAFLPFAALLLWQKRRSVPLEGLVLCVLSIIAALAMRRFEPIAVITSWPYLGEALATLDWTAYRPGVKRNIHVMAHAVLVVAMAPVCWVCHFPSVLSATMVYTDNTYPLLSIFQSHLDPTARIFNDPTTGSWLIAMGANNVFIDTRLDMYPKQFVAATTDCLDGKTNCQDFLNKWRVTHILTRDDTVLSQRLLASKDWLLVLDDGLLNWWVRNTPAMEAQLRSWQLADEQITYAGLPPYMARQTVETRCVRYLHLARKYMAENCPQLAAQECAKGLALMPQSSALRSQSKLCTAAVAGKGTF